MGIRYEDTMPDRQGAPHNDPERAHIANESVLLAAAALGDPDLPRALAALDHELGGLGDSLEVAAARLADAAGDLRRTQSAIRILSRPASLPVMADKDTHP